MHMFVEFELLRRVRLEVFVVDAAQKRVTLFALDVDTQNCRDALAEDHDDVALGRNVLRFVEAEDELRERRRLVLAHRRTVVDTPVLDAGDPRVVVANGELQRCATVAEGSGDMNSVLVIDELYTSRVVRSAVHGEQRCCADVDTVALRLIGLCRSGEAKGSESCPCDSHFHVSSFSGLTCVLKGSTMR